MLSTVFKFLVGVFSNGTGQKVGTAVTWGAELAVLAPIVYWLMAHKGEDAVTLSFTFTYGEVIVICGIAFFVLKIIQYTRTGTPADRSEFRG